MGLTLLVSDILAQCLKAQETVDRLEKLITEYE